MNNQINNVAKDLLSEDLYNSFSNALETNDNTNMRFIAEGAYDFHEEKLHNSSLNEFEANRDDFRKAQKLYGLVIQNYLNQD